MFQPHRATQDMAIVGASHHMVFGQDVELAVAEKVEAAVADMHAMAGAAGQDQGGEGGRHAGEVLVGAALRDDPGIDSIERTRGRLTHAERSGQVEKAVEKCAHRQFGGFAPALAAADAICHGGDHVATRVDTRAADAGGGIILIIRPLPALRGEADLEAQVVVVAFQPAHGEGFRASPLPRARGEG